MTIKALTAVAIVTAALASPAFAQDVDQAAPQKTTHALRHYRSSYNQVQGPAFVVPREVNRHLSRQRELRPFAYWRSRCGLQSVRQLSFPVDHSGIEQQWDGATAARLHAGPLSRVSVFRPVPSHPPRGARLLIEIQRDQPVWTPH